MSTPTTEQVAAARAGKFTARFARGDDAKAFFDRITGAAPSPYTGRVDGPEGWHVTNVRLNRKGGRTVTFERDRELPDEDGMPAWQRYWYDMAETVGFYGSTFGEYPNNAGRRTAYLNGLAGQATM